MARNSKKRQKTLNMPKELGLCSVFRYAGMSEVYRTGIEISKGGNQCMCKEEENLNQKGSILTLLLHMLDLGESHLLHLAYLQTLCYFYSLVLIRMFDSFKNKQR